MQDFTTEGGTIPPRLWFKSVDVLLTDEAAIWAETTPDVARLLDSPVSTERDVRAFRTRFLEKFPFRFAQDNYRTFDAEIQDLAQGHNESLTDYYERVSALIHRIGTARSDGSSDLNTLEETMLSTIIRAFICGLADDENGVA